MGKGQRSRNQREQTMLDNPTKHIAEKKDKSLWIYSAASIFVIILVVGILAFNLLVTNGVLLRSKSVAETENFKVTGTMMQYATMSTYQNYVYMYQQNGWGDYLGFDVSKPLSGQLQSGETEKTWLDYFKDQALSQVEQMLVLAEAAKKAGIELNDDDIKAIDDTVSAIAETGATYGYTESQYLAAAFGEGVKAKDIKAFMEISSLANKYSEKMNEDIETEITDEDVATYADTIDLSDYYLVDVLTHKEEFSIEAGLTEEEITAAKDAHKAKFDGLMAATTEAEFEAALSSFLANATQEELDVFVATSRTTTTKNSAFTVDAAAWLLETESDLTEDTADKGGAPTRKTGDVKLFEKETKPEEGAADQSTKYTVCVYFVTATPYLDETATKDVAHILVKFDSSTPTAEEDAAAKAEAEAILAEFKSGEQTKDAFITLGEENTDDSSVLYENVKKDEMVKEFNDWIFDAARNVGDTDVVKTDYGYHVMYFVGDGKPEWFANTLDTIVSEKNTKALEALTEEFAVEVNQNNLNKIKG